MHKLRDDFPPFLLKSRTCAAAIGLGISPVPLSIRRLDEIQVHKSAHVLGWAGGVGVIVHQQHTARCARPEVGERLIGKIGYAARYNNSEANHSKYHCPHQNCTFIHTHIITVLVIRHVRDRTDTFLLPFGKLRQRIKEMRNTIPLLSKRNRKAKRRGCRPYISTAANPLARIKRFACTALNDKHRRQKAERASLPLFRTVLLSVRRQLGPSSCYNCKNGVGMDLQVWESEGTRNPGVEEVRPGVCLGTFREIPGYSYGFRRNIAIPAIHRHFWKNCFQSSNSNRSTDRFWSGNTDILL